VAVAQAKNVILTNPDIFHLVAHFRYQNPAYNRTELPLTLARNPDLYVADEYIFWGASGSSDSEQFAVDSS